MKPPEEVQLYIDQKDIEGYRDYCFEFHGLRAKEIAEGHQISIEDIVEIFKDVVHETFMVLLKAEPIALEFAEYFASSMNRACEISEKNPYQYVYKTCYGIASRMIYNMEGGEYFLADDMLQDSLLLLMKQLKKETDRIEDLKHYYLRIVKTRYWQMKRKDNMQDQHVDLEKLEGSEYGSAALTIEAVEESEKLSLYRKVRSSKSLSKECREFIDLFFDRGVILKDIAEILLVTPGRVSQIKSHCLDEVEVIIKSISRLN